MTHILWTTAIFRILAVWFACGVLMSIPTVLSSGMETMRLPQESPVPLRAWFIPTVFGLAMTAIIAVGLWTRAADLADLVWRDRPAPESAPPFDRTVLQQSAFIGAGLFLVVNGLPEITEFAGYYFSLPDEFAIGPQGTAFLPRLIGHGIQIASGVALVWWSGDLARSLSRDVDAPDADRSDLTSSRE